MPGNLLSQSLFLYLLQEIAFTYSSVHSDDLLNSCVASCTYCAVHCRVCRRTVLDETLLIRVPRPDAVALAETIFKAGVHQFPRSEFVLIMQTGYRITLKNEQPVRISP